MEGFTHIQKSSHSPVEWVYFREMNFSLEKWETEPRTWPRNLHQKMAFLKFLKLYQTNCLAIATNFANILGSKHRLTYNYILSTFINLNEWCKMCRNLSTLSLRGLKTVRTFLSLVLEQMTVYLGAVHKLRWQARGRGIRQMSTLVNEVGEGIKGL